MNTATWSIWGDVALVTTNERSKGSDGTHTKQNKCKMCKQEEGARSKIRVLCVISHNGEEFLLVDLSILI